MDKTITIYKGDEYRAKIATEIDKSDLFAETYIRAFSIIDEIIAELTDAREMQDSGKENFNGMGNNIIVFSGQRGQGKTSIMQSFAKWLKQDVTADNIIRNSKENIEWKNLVARVKQSGFVVLESIDPSSLEKAESILQVLITRLFYLFDKYRKTHSNNDVTSEREWMQSIQNITTLFQKCLTNIDYLKMGRPKEWEMENLEDLVQISNSSVFKENLKELIDKLLKTLDEKEKQKKFLIIPIDDTDLATQEVFDICEDIRNYLSIPNIIILMAVDYKQLIYSVTQKYLTNYDKMLISSYDMGFEASKCYEIATQYLEKVLPAGHRIDLPQIEAIINEKPQSISFKYMDKENNDLLGLTLDKDSNSDDRGIHVQLLKVLYNRTGIIFCDKEVKQAFFPRKMRELTHFVKLLGDMNDIVCDEVYQKRDRTSMLRVEQNITVLRQYFLDYWCAKNLTLIQKEFIEKLDIVMRSHDKNKIFAEIQKFYSEINIGTFDEFFQKMVESENNINLQIALKICYTLAMNMWHAEIMEEIGDYDKLYSFLDRVIYLNSNSECGCNKVEFEVEEERAFKKEQDIDRRKKCQTLFCYEKDGKMRFSLLKPLFHLESLENEQEKKDSSSNKDTQEFTEEVASPLDTNYLIWLRNGVVNYDVRKQLSDSIWEKVSEDITESSYKDYIQRFYSSFQPQEMDLFNLTNLNQTILKVLRKIPDGYEDILNEVYIDNQNFLEIAEEDKSESKQEQEKEQSFEEEDGVRENAVDKAAAVNCDEEQGKAKFFNGEQHNTEGE